MLEASIAQQAAFTFQRAVRSVSLRAACVALLGGSALSMLPRSATATIAQRTTVTTVTLPAALETLPTQDCTWGEPCSITPRLYQAPMANNSGTFVGWTDSSGNGHVSQVVGGVVQKDFPFTGTWLRGLVAHPDNSFAVLLEVNPSATNIYQRSMEIELLNAAGVVQWTTALPSIAAVGTTTGAVPDDIDIGDSRLTYGGGQYGAYFAVKAYPDSGGLAHNGDQLSYVSDAGVFASPPSVYASSGGYANNPNGWSWGLSHSLSELADYQSSIGHITTVGVTDCYAAPAGINPGPGLYADDAVLLQADAGNCGGATAIQLGQMSASSGNNWLVAFSAQSEAAYTNLFGTLEPAYSAPGIGVVSFNGATDATAGVSTVTWLTNTDGTDQRDPVLARIGTSLGSSRFLVGWRLVTEANFNLEVINPSAGVINPLEVVSPAIGWGIRDDSLKTRPDGSVTWLQGASGSTTLQMYRYQEIKPGRDFAGTSNSDILWQNSNGDTVIWLLQNGQHTSSTDLGIAPTGWSIAGTGDFNGDGSADILWRNATSGDTVIWYMQNGQHTSSADLGAVPTAWNIAAVGDFNDDGTTDILWRNSSSGDTVIWLLSNGAISSSRDLGVVPASWTVAATGDFNGKGTSDILWRDTSGDTVIWFIQNGALTSSAYLGTVPAVWSIAATGDFNGDGKSDILWHNTSGDTVVWFINGGSVASSTDLGTVPTAWSIAGAGDYNADGTTDILWRNTSTGDTVTWFMQNGQVSTSADLGAPPNSWSILSPIIQ